MTALPVPIEPAAMEVDQFQGELEMIEQSGDSCAVIAALYREHQPRITAYVVRRVRSTHEAEDIVANVFLSMVRGLPRYRRSSTPFVAWLYRIATNEINRWARWKRIRRFFGLPTDVSDANRVSDEEGEELRRALSELPLRYQNALSLHYLEEFSVDEVAVILGTPAGTVKSRLARGRELLRRKLLCRKA